MEPNMPVIARKVWHIMRIAFFTLRKSISKKKFILLNLNLMMKRGKIAGKALSNLMFQFHHHATTTGTGGSHLDAAPREYEFSCSNTPLYRHYFPGAKRKNHQQKYNMPYSFIEYEDMIDNVDMEAVNKVIEMMASNDVALPGLGFGQSPMPVRQLRVTDSPYPVQNLGEDNHVDQAAEEFIKRFYAQLKQQN